MQTNCGSFTIDLAVKTAPATTASFVSLVRKGFYDNTIFHRIVPGFIIQGGDPTASGLGGPGYSTVDKPPPTARYTLGTVAMAKTQAEPDGTSGSQFFIVTAQDAQLPPQYAIVGEVKDGLDTVTKIGELGDASTEQPTEIVEIQKATVSSRVTVAAVVLAAGAATRYGGPKQAEFLPAVLAALAGAPLAEVVVVAGAHPLRVDSTQARVVQCDRWADGPGASLRCGLEALGGEVEHALVVLADGPELDPRAVERLIEHREDGPRRRRGLRRGAQPPRGPVTLCLARRARRGRPGDSGSCSSTAPTWRLQAMSISADREGEGRTRRKEDVPMLELAHTLDAVPQTSPLAEARERRDLSIKQVAYRSGLTEAEIEWLEEGRIYRFPSQNAAMLAAVVYATALGIDRFEARRLAGLPVTGAIRVNARARLIVGRRARRAALGARRDDRRAGACSRGRARSRPCRTRT